MAVYLVGLLPLTPAFELSLALFLASEGEVPSPSSDFRRVYLVVDIGRFTRGGVLLPEVLRRSGRRGKATGGSDISRPPSRLIGDSDRGRGL